MSTPTAPECARFIAVDWGTTNFRAALVDAHGAVTDRIQAPRGVLQVPRGGFRAAFRELLAPWLEAPVGVPVLMAGMVGSVDGLVEVPYLPCPVSLDDVADAMVTVPDVDGERRVLIVPGLRGRSVAGQADVMRGEEVQIVGAIGDAGAGASVFCLPGTHSKWVTLEDRRVTGFSTSMTGDVFAAVRQHTILNRFAAEGEHDPAAFTRGLDQSAQPGGLLHHLFSVRSEVLLGDLTVSTDAAYLSGLLIGHECRSMVAALARRCAVTVIGSDVLTGLYTTALERLGVAVDGVEGDAASVRGLQRLADRAGV